MLFDLAVFAAAFILGMGVSLFLYQTYLLEKADSFCRTPVRIGDKLYYLVPEELYIRRMPTSPKWDEEYCELPPAGWYCTRERGHDGPCAALPVMRAK